MAKPGEKPVQETDKREAELRAKEEALERDLKSLNIIRAHLKEHEAASVASGNTVPIGEIGESRAVEMVTDFDKGSLDVELFMNELVMINVYPDGMPGALDVVVVTVNGVNQPIIRGRDQRVKRKYIEALARSRITNYEQVIADPARPESLSMKPIAALTYPFVVREDRNPKGPAWLKAILDQPM